MEKIECPYCHSDNTRFMYGVRDTDCYLCLSCLQKFNLTPLELEKMGKERKA